MTGVFYVLKPDGSRIEIPNNLIIKGGEPQNSAYFEAYDFYYNRELINSIYSEVYMLKAGEKIEIVCEVEE